MAIVFSENVVEIAVIQEYVGQPVVNVWHMYLDSEWGNDTVEAVVLDFANNWQDHILEMQVDDLSLVRFDWRSLDPSNSAVGTLDPDPGKNTEGTSTGAGLPPNVAMLINKRTTGRPRGARDGRCFLAGITEGSVNERGIIDAPTLSIRQGLADDFYNGISDSSITAAGDRYPVVLETTAASRAPGTASVNLNSRRVTSLPIDSLVSTQRDRLR